VKALFSPSLRGRAAEGGRGSLTRHLELGVEQHAAIYLTFNSFVRCIHLDWR
jgi:hypothetical protein